MSTVSEKLGRIIGGNGGLSAVVQAYSLLAAVSLGFFGVLHVLDEKPWLGYIELLGAIVFVVNIGLARVSRTVSFARYLFLLAVLAFLVVMLLTGGTDRTGAFWFFVFPVAAFFLTNTRQGLLWMTLLIVMTTGMLVLNGKGSIALAYTPVEIRQLLVSVVVVAIGIYAYQSSREQLTDESLESSRLLHSEKVRADTIVRQIREGVVATDAAGIITFINPSAEEMLGYEASQAIGKPFTEVMPMLDESGHEVPKEQRPLLRALQSGVSVSATAVYRRKDGRTLPVSLASEPVMVGGKVIGGIGLFRDTSEEQAVARAKSEFVTVASHQLRTPISAISWLSELLLNEDVGELSPDQLEHIRGIYHSNQRMSRLVSEMLIVSSLELGTMPVIPQKLQLIEIAKQLVHEELGTHSGSQQPHVIQDYEPNMPLLQADPDIIKLLLRNLLSNARKYTTNTGEIKLRIHIDRAAKLQPSSQGSVAITVQDNGYGIPTTATDRVFSKFFRAENILHKDTDGTGLGLYIVKSLLDYVGGRISFESVEGKGTTFTMLLPLEGMTKHTATHGAAGATTHQDVSARQGQGHA
ncbi:MAG TPA: ATP-binding protein [Candidatus Saccharimonadales bacterium]|nr:ATP-binding protein [Candidatus Saccharimonadales bacterium]